MDLSHLVAEASAAGEVLGTGALVLRVLLAAALGAFISFRPWRVFLRGVQPPQPRLAHAQTLMAIVGAVMVVVIGGSAARAFGLVGLGSFVRFRSGISDPRESVVLLMMIGIGMASGVGLLGEAMSAALLIGLSLMIFDMLDGLSMQRTRVVVYAENPKDVRLVIVREFSGVNILDESSVSLDLGKASGQLLLEMNVRGIPDAAKLRDEFERRGVPGVRRVALVLAD